MKKKVALILLCILVVGTFTGCANYETVEIDTDNITREEIDESKEAVTGKLEGEDYVVALQAVYSDELFSDEYGIEFDVEGPFMVERNITTLVSDSTIYKGESICYFKVNGQNWAVCVKKGYLGSWHVDYMTALNYDPMEEIF